jgi:hypothetical protein
MYPQSHNYAEKRLSSGLRAAMGHTRIWSIWVLAVMLLISAGVSYRVLATKLDVLTSKVIELPVPLSFVPAQMGDWKGRDIPIAENTLRVADNDAYLNRLYVNELSNEWANIYIAYTARPRTMVGHRPQVCYVGGGWILDSTDKIEIESGSGLVIPSRIHRFHKSSPSYEEIIVLNYYIVNGQLTNDESVFSGLGWRTPNIEGDPALYVAQVQVSSVSEHAIRVAVNDFTEIILKFFPDKDGNVRADQYMKSQEISMN